MMSVFLDWRCSSEVRASGSYPLCRGFESLHRQNFQKTSWMAEEKDGYLLSTTPLA